MPSTNCDGRVAFVCPGQGGHDLRLVEELAEDGFYLAHRDLIAAIAGEDVIERARHDGSAYLRRNEIASLLVVLASCAWREKLSLAGIEPQAVAGYSVGQWTAMHFAGMLDFPSLLDVVWRRALLMNRQADARPGAMLGVIGLAREPVEAACAEVSRDGLVATVSNVNCVGQLTVAGDAAAVDRLSGLLRDARKLAPVNVSGAWHCPLMAPVAPLFAAMLETLDLAPAAVPVADNVTGEELPQPGAQLRRRLAEHLSRPVLWQANVLWLAAQGVGRFVEVGHGDMLTKFGFFIDRRRDHVTARRLLAGEGG